MEKRIYSWKEASVYTIFIFNKKGEAKRTIFFFLLWLVKEKGGSENEELYIPKNVLHQFGDEIWRGETKRNILFTVKVQTNGDFCVEVKLYKVMGKGRLST